ncbi:uncharacterized protein LOC100906575, partial [Galendromus occidentalis]|uniref:Uncharacterized protein LOC100906575 n=1 Tax=Galendromus occidentalis TaxID=34638 RepID=A0AAJ6VVJ1_9ACAR
GVSAILHALREDFLLIHARRISRKIISKCQLCKIFISKAAQLPTPALPSFRIERSRPFRHTLAGFCGPFRYKRDSAEVGKAYILIFTCAASRAVYLELTTDLSTAEVFGALQKFVNRFPSVRFLLSDNGASFVRAAKELKLIYEHIKEGDIKRWLANSFIEWKFATPAAPWTQGAVERM